MADTISYFFKFSTSLEAANDPIVGPYLVPGNPANFYNPIDVYNLAVSSVDTIPGYWCLVYTSDDLTSNPSLQFAINEFIQTGSGGQILVNNLIYPETINNLQILTQGRINHFRIGLSETDAIPSPPGLPGPSPTFLSSLVGPVPAQFNMYWWDYGATHTDFTTDFWLPGDASIQPGSLAPDGTLTATRLTEDANLSPLEHRLTPFGDNHPIGFPPLEMIWAAPWRVSVIVKPKQRTRIVVRWSVQSDANSVIEVGFDLAGGQVFATSAGSNSVLLGTSIRPISNGFYLCSLDLQYNGTAGLLIGEILLDAGTGNQPFNTTYIGDGTSGVDLWWFHSLPVQAFAITTLDFADDFVGLSGVDLRDTRAPGFNWYIHNLWPNKFLPEPDASQPPTPYGVLTISSPSVLKIYNPNPNAPSYSSQIMSCCTDNANGYIGKAWNGPIVFDGRIAYNNALAHQFYALGNTNAPAFWGPSIEVRCNNGLNTSGNLMEVDTDESFPENASTSSLHSYQTLPQPTVRLYDTTSPSQYVAADQFEQKSFMWIPMHANNNVAGIFLFFLNGQFIYGKGYNTTIPPQNAFWITDLHHLPIILITGENTSSAPGGGWPYFIDYIRVYIDPKLSSSSGVAPGTPQPPIII